MNEKAKATVDQEIKLAELANEAAKISNERKLIDSLTKLINSKSSSDEVKITAMKTLENINTKASKSAGGTVNNLEETANNIAKNSTKKVNTNTIGGFDEETINPDEEIKEGFWTKKNKIRAGILAATVAAVALFPWSKLINNTSVQDKTETTIEKEDVTQNINNLETKKMIGGDYIKGESVNHFINRMKEKYEDPTNQLEKLRMDLKNDHLKIIPGLENDFKISKRKNPCGKDGIINISASSFKKTPIINEKETSESERIKNVKVLFFKKDPCSKKYYKTHNENILINLNKGLEDKNIMTLLAIKNLKGVSVNYNKNINTLTVYASEKFNKMYCGTNNEYKYSKKETTYEEKVVKKIIRDIMNPKKDIVDQIIENNSEINGDENQSNIQNNQINTNGGDIEDSFNNTNNYEDNSVYNSRYVPTISSEGLGEIGGGNGTSNTGESVGNIGGGNGTSNTGESVGNIGGGN